MKTVIFWVLSIFTLFFWSYGGVDMFFTLTGNEAYLKGFPPDMIAWMQGFPLWRKALWGLTSLLGTFGGIMLVLRRRSAPGLLWSASLLMGFGFVVLDILMNDGASYYGLAGMIANNIMIVLAFLLSWHASLAFKRRKFKR